MGVTKETACAVVARDHDGVLLDEFTFKIRKGNSVHAETWGVLGD